MDKYKAVCFDLDGTVYRGKEAIPEAVELIATLSSRGTLPYYVTNNSSMTTGQLKAKLATLGIQAQEDHIMTSAIAAAAYCKDHFDGASVMMIGEEGLRTALVEQGFSLTDRNPDIVVMGIDRDSTYAKLAEACLAIRAGAAFVATNGDKAFPTERGLVPGNGSFVKLMEYATGVIPVIVGKPEPHMLHFIQQQGGYQKDEMVMIGDNYETDIEAGLRFGIDTIHVEGGVTSREAVLTAERQPTYLFSKLTDWNK
ncbi:TIGR01457 family HAD-type hydrolase [Sporosarcina sp. Te-1]|uniref:TIGR01457 family HAD-type hydrolase n=1 Tax=Sporosarcina sp. Te-1 TaxID=2818390 RepID=UPI001A9DE449|nr:TIGR01457 family HAD-type hydrolase [Sporosarcina sp. Te-1]QTD42710.1 TIGR01457 family HAD-type hydrolase [Sporosarcina sp. Te-1]